MAVLQAFHVPELPRCQHVNVGFQQDEGTACTVGQSITVLCLFSPYYLISQLGEMHWSMRLFDCLQVTFFFHGAVSKEKHFLIIS
jgi:hypothetical protein